MLPELKLLMPNRMIHFDPKNLILHGEGSRVLGDLLAHSFFPTPQRFGFAKALAETGMPRSHTFEKILQWS